MIDRLREKFPVDEVRGRGTIDSGMTTGFVWTRQSGSIALGANREYFSRALENPRVNVIVAPLAAAHGALGDKLVIITAKAAECFYYMHNYLVNAQAHEPLPEPFIHPGAIIEDGVRLGRGVRVEKGARIGANTVLIGPVTIGENTTVEPGVVIGGEGLFAKRIAGELVQIRHYGGVDVEKNAYIHSGAVIVKSAMMGEVTRIGTGVHVGVMCNVGHDAQIGDESVLSSNTVIAGRARIGRNVWIGASATVSNAISIGDGAKVNIGAVCILDVPPGAEVSGNFAQNHKVALKSYLRGLRDE